MKKRLKGARLKLKTKKRKVSIDEKDWVTEHSEGGDSIEEPKNGVTDITDISVCLSPVIGTTPPLDIYHSKPLTDREDVLMTSVVNEDEDKEGHEVVNDYTFMKELGSGAFAVVHLCRKKDGSLYAVKEFNKKYLKRKRNWKKVDGKMIMTNALDTVKLEVALMKKLDHPNICKLIEVIDSDETSRLYMVIEFVEQGQVMDFDSDSSSYKSKKEEAIDGGGGCLSEETSRGYFKDLVDGMGYLHAHKIAHRDLKPENLLIAKDGKLKIVDFGVATVFHGDDTLSATAGTSYFMAPECNDSNFSGYKVDIWAMGVCLYCFMFGKLPFWTNDEMKYFDTVKTMELSFPEDIACSDELKSLLSQLLEKDPEKRITLNEIKSRAWLVEGYDEDKMKSPVLHRMYSREEITETEFDSAFTNLSSIYRLSLLKVKLKGRVLAAKKKLLKTNQPIILDSTIPPLPSTGVSSISFKL